VTGEARERVTKAAVAEFRANHETLAPEYPFFPQPLHDPYSSRFNTFRGQLGDAQGVHRSDKVGRMRDVERQFLFFDAPVGIIFTMDRRLEWASFLCYGCFLQNVMLARQGPWPGHLPATDLVAATPCAARRTRHSRTTRW
jgi:hypothetical protein